MIFVMVGHLGMTYGTARCRECGLTFQAKWSGSRYCSVTCQLRRQYSEATSGCFMWTGAILKSGYGSVRVAGKSIRAHRAMWEAVNGFIPDGHVVRHKCDTPACVNPDHLELGTQVDNVADSVKRGRVARGSLLPHSKLSILDVAIIKAKLADGETPAALAREFGVTRTSIVDIRSGRNWRHL